MASILPGFGLGAVAGVVDTLLIRRSRSIDDIFPDVVIEENHSDEIEITSHPVANGSPISDHAFRRPAELTMRIGFSPSRPLGLNTGILGDVVSRVTDITGRGYIKDSYEKLLALQRDFRTFDVITGKRSYQNMLLRSLSVTTDQTSENALFVEARFQEVFIVETQSSTLPPALYQSMPAQTAAPVDAGAKQPVPTSKSIAKTLADFGRSLF